MISTRIPAPGRRIGRTRHLSQARLRGIVRGIVAQRDEWLATVGYDPRRRWYRRLELCDDYEVWLLSWLPGQRTGFHDHGSSAGAFAVAHGILSERAARGGMPAPTAPALGTGAVRSFGAHYVHDVANNFTGPAVSVHAYSPPLSAMRRFAETPEGLVPTANETAGQW